MLLCHTGGRIGDEPKKCHVLFEWLFKQNCSKIIARGGGSAVEGEIVTK
jgi:hypothetical protein